MCILVTCSLLPKLICFYVLPQCILKLYICIILLPASHVHYVPKYPKIACCKAYDLDIHDTFVHQLIWTILTQMLQKAHNDKLYSPIRQLTDRKTHKQYTTTVSLYARQNYKKYLKKTIKLKTKHTHTASIKSLKALIVRSMHYY